MFDTLTIDMNTKIFLPFLILFLTAFGAQAQHRRGHHRPHGIELSGRITSTDHEIIDFASVYLKGTSHGAYVDTGGRYRFRAPAGTYTLTVSAIGYETIEKEITLRRGENFVQDFTLRPEHRQLDEVVVLGYGSQTRASLTGAVSQIDSKVIGIQNVSTVSKALEGSIPGLQVAAADGQPGVDMGIRVRGVSSATGNNASALIVIDGVPAQNENPLSNMNPQDIASVTVLKDAASTAMYGSRGANGVVLITTKKGQSGKTRISFDARWGWNSIGSFNTSGMTSAADY